MGYLGIPLVSQKSWIPRARLTSRRHRKPSIGNWFWYDFFDHQKQIPPKKNKNRICLKVLPKNQKNSPTKTCQTQSSANKNKVEKKWKVNLTKIPLIYPSAFPKRRCKHAILARWKLGKAGGEVDGERVATILEMISPRENGWCIYHRIHVWLYLPTFTIKINQMWLGIWGVATQIIFVGNFHPENSGKMKPIWQAYVSKGLVQPPTRWICPQERDHFRRTFWIFFRRVSRGIRNMCFNLQDGPRHQLYGVK